MNTAQRRLLVRVLLVLFFAVLLGWLFTTPGLPPV